MNSADHDKATWTVCAVGRHVHVQVSKVTDDYKEQKVKFSRDPYLTSSLPEFVDNFKGLTDGQHWLEQSKTF